MIVLRRNRNAIHTQAKQAARNSMLVTGSTCERLIQLSFGAGCFKGKDVRNLDSRDALAVYNFLCSLFSFSLREFNRVDGVLSIPQTRSGKRSSLKQSGRTRGSGDAFAAPVIVLIDATKIPLKALRIILRACQSALAYKIRQAIIVEPEGLFGQQRAGIDVLLDAYDFKTIICPKSKLWKYLGAADDIYDPNGTLKPAKSPAFAHDGGWTSIKQDFHDYFTSGPAYHGGQNKPSANTHGWPGLVLTTSSAILAKFLRKDNSIFIELVENDLDTVSIRKSRKPSIDSIYATLGHKKTEKKRLEETDANDRSFQYDMTKAADENSKRKIANTREYVELLSVQPKLSAINLKKQPIEAATVADNTVAEAKARKIVTSVKGEVTNGGLRFGIGTLARHRPQLTDFEHSAATQMQQNEKYSLNQKQMNEANVCLAVNTATAFKNTDELQTNESVTAPNLAVAATADISNSVDAAATETKYDSQLIESQKEKNFGQNDCKKQKELALLMQISAQIHAIEDVLNWLQSVGESKLAEIDVKAVDTTQPCCCCNAADKDEETDSETVDQNNNNDTTTTVGNNNKLQCELKESTEKMVDKCAELGENVEKLAREAKMWNEFCEEPDTLATVDEKLNSLKELKRNMLINVHNFRTKLNKLALTVDNCRRFRRAITHFYKESDELLKLICSDQQIKLEQPHIQKQIGNLKNKLNTVEESIRTAIEAGTSFCAVLRDTPTVIVAGDNTTQKNDASASTARANLAQNMEFVAANLTAVGERRKRCCALVKLRVARLKKLEEIVKCEEFGNQIAEKMSECAKLMQNGKQTITTLVNNKKTEKRLYDYAKHLARIALTLRRLNGRELRPNIELSEKLEATWRKLNPIKSNSILLINCLNMNNKG